MSRDVTAGAATASAAGHVVVGYFAKMEFDSGDTRYWSGRGDKVGPDGGTYTGVGDLGSISGMEESVEHKAFGIKLSLSGIPPAALAIAFGEDVQGRPLTVWKGYLDSDHDLIADAVLWFRGRMDTMDVVLGEAGSISLTAESLMIDWGRPRVIRLSDADQQARFAGDKGFEFGPEATEKEIFWGQATPKGRRV